MKFWRIINIKLIIKDIVKGVIDCWILSVIFCTALLNGWLPKSLGPFPETIQYYEFINLFILFTILFIFVIIFKMYLGRYKISFEGIKNLQIIEDNSTH